MCANIAQAGSSHVDTASEGHVSTLGALQRAHDSLLPSSARLQALLVDLWRQVRTSYSKIFPQLTNHA